MLMMHELQMCDTGSIFIVETWNFQTLFPTPSRLWIKIKKRTVKIDPITCLIKERNQYLDNLADVKIFSLEIINTIYWFQIYCIIWKNSTWILIMTKFIFIHQWIFDRIYFLFLIKYQCAPIPTTTWSLLIQWIFLTPMPNYSNSSRIFFNYTFDLEYKMLFYEFKSTKKNYTRNFSNKALKGSCIFTALVKPLIIEVMY